MVPHSGQHPVKRTLYDERFGLHTERVDGAEADVNQQAIESGSSPKPA